MWTFYQRTGELLHDYKPFAIGYARIYAGKNNPDMETIKDTGPLPAGVYRIGDPYEHPHLGPITMDLKPDSANEMFGRGDFRIHGDSTTSPGFASHGCIVLNHAARIQIADLASQGERLLEVKKERE